MVETIFNKELVEGKTPENWRNHFILPVFKGK